jgi:hypothetical protein
LDTQEFKLSRDHEELTMTQRSAGGGNPEVFVFDRDEAAHG